MERFTLDELEKYDGKEGRKAYIAYKGKIYDVSGSKMWKDGGHMHTHFAGHDMSDELEKAPHSESVLSNFPVVGTLDERMILKPENEEKASEVSQENKTLEKLQALYAIFHPHPVLVHFPMGLIPFSFLMNLLYLYTKIDHFIYAGFYALVCGFLGLIAATFAGIFSWAVNYDRLCDTIFKMKFTFTALSFIFTGIQVLMFTKHFGGSFYYVLSGMSVFTLFIVAYNGGKLTWHHN